MPVAMDRVRISVTIQILEFLAGTEMTATNAYVYCSKKDNGLGVPT